MFTHREAAHRAWRNALTDNRHRALGLRPDERHDYRAGRQRLIAQALATVDDALGTPRIGFREPDDAALTRMAAQLRAALEVNS